MKELFVFGAGASHASSRTPLGKNLVWDYFTDCHGLYQMGKNGKPDSRALDETEKNFVNFGKFLKSIDKLFPGILVHDKWKKSMNNAMMFIPKIDKKYYIDEIMEELFIQGDFENIKLIQRLTIEHITKSARGTQNSLYEKFSENLKNKTSTNKISIISFNFDCLLCDDFIKEVYFDYCIDFEEVYKEAKQYKKANGIPLIKLNGSFDWAWNKNTKKISLLFPYVSHVTYKNDNIEPYIFLPHQQKSGIISSLWDRAGREIKTADKINIIGYSFPDYDKDVSELFRENLKPETKIEVVDVLDSRPIRNKYKHLFPQISDVVVYSDGFKGYMDRCR